MTASSARIRRVARERLGLEQLRPGQEEVVAAVTGGRDALAVMPTGHGKSAIYQVAALLIDGPTLVVSPLIALQRDQVEDLDDASTGGAAAVSSHVGERARREALEDFEADDLEFLFLAPEQLAKADVLERVRAARPSLVVVDEAHCISDWGHDFRPDYLRLGAVAEEIGRPRILALTATAAPPVREEIVRRLGMDDPLIEVRGFDRPELHLEVRRFQEKEHKLRAARELAAELEGPGLVYGATRQEVEDLAAALREHHGLRAAPYHAGLAAGERDQVQEAFMQDALDIVVATTAFGMGVDKPNVRFVLHADVPDSLDAYHQEIGRAGRDGDPARAILLYRAQDVGLRRFFAAGGQVEPAELERVARTLERHSEPIHPAELAEELDLSKTRLATAITRLEEAGAVEVAATGEVERTARRIDAETLEEAARAQSDREENDRSRVDMMRAYADLLRGCRREFLLSYFGQRFEPPCGNCDLCDEGRSAPAAEIPFPPGIRVEHPKWGEGTVERGEEGKVTVRFDTVGHKTLALEAVEDNDLLRTIEA